MSADETCRQCAHFVRNPSGYHACGVCNLMTYWEGRHVYWVRSWSPACLHFEDKGAGL